MRNDFLEAWHGREQQLEQEQPKRFAAFEAAYASGDYDVAKAVNALNRMLGFGRPEYVRLP